MRRSASSRSRLCPELATAKVSPRPAGGETAPRLTQAAASPYLSRVLASFSSSVLPAILGLIGVAVGGFLTGYFSYGLDRRTRSANLLQAKRRVALEIGSLILDLDHLARERTIALEGGVLTTDAWRDEQGALARGLAEQEWEQLAVFYLGVQAFRTLVEVKQREPLDDEEIARVRRLIDSGSGRRTALGAPTPIPLPAGGPA